MILSISKCSTESNVKRKSDMYSQQSRKKYRFLLMGKRKWSRLATVKLGHGELALEHHISVRDHVEAPTSVCYLWFLTE